MKSFYRLLTALMIFSLMGCATFSNDVGSRNWHRTRVKELDQALEKEEISKEKYLELKQETDQIRQEYQETYKSHYTGYGYYGKRHYRGRYHRGYRYYCY